MTRYVIYAALLLASLAIPPVVFLLIGAFTYGYLIPPSRGLALQSHAPQAHLSHRTSLTPPTLGPRQGLGSSLCGCVILLVA